MKKHLFLIGIIAMIGGTLLAQAAQPGTRPITDPRFANIRIERDAEGLDINVQSLIPETGFYKAKADTYQATGKYRFVMDDKLMRENSEFLLNKWLKESK